MRPKTGPGRYLPQPCFFMQIYNQYSLIFSVLRLYRINHTGYIDNYTLFGYSMLISGKGSIP